MRAVRRGLFADAVKILHREEFPTRGLAWQAVLEDFSTKELFRRVDEGDPFCTSVFKESVAHLGMILSFVIDILNPEVCMSGIRN